MKARALIDGVRGTYGPETLKVIGKAFDDAWEEIAPCFSRSGLQAQSVRLTLANAILEVAREDIAIEAGKIVLVKGSPLKGC